MHTYHGTVTSGLGLATRNLAHVGSTIAARTGLVRVVPGTLNVRLRCAWVVEPDAIIEADEYDGHEYLKLQRCVVGGIRAVIVRPHLHERVPGWGHGTDHLELVSGVHMRIALGGLADGARVRVEIGGDAAWWARARNGDAHMIWGQVTRAQRYLGRRIRVA